MTVPTVLQTTAEKSVLCSLMLTARAIPNSESALGVRLTRTSFLCFERIGFLIYL